MGLLLMGSSGPTAQQIAKLLCLNNVNLEQIERSFSKFLDPLRVSNMFHIANKIYLNHQLHASQEFHGLATSVFLSDTETIDFNSVSAHETVNGWVESRTSQTVHDMLRPDALAEAEILVVNAIRFRGMWQKPFSSDRTSIGLFYWTETQSIEVNMMHGAVGGFLKQQMLTSF